MSEHRNTGRSDPDAGYHPMDDTHQGIIAWFARNHVAANLLMMLIVGTGLISAMTIRTQITPDLESQSLATRRTSRVTRVARSTLAVSLSFLKPQLRED